MALVLKDRVKETTSTSGTGSITLLGAVQGFQGFSSIGEGNTTYYSIVGTTEWEVGIGTYSGGTLSRDTVLASSLNNTKVAFSSGVKDVFCTYAASKAVSTDTLPVTGATSASSPNATVNVASLSAAASSTNADLALVPKGSGSLLADIPDGTSAGGNKRGIYAVDLQFKRNSADQVASGQWSTLSGGENNKASGDDSTVGGGAFNIASGADSTVAGGGDNQATNTQATVSGGSGNRATATQSTVGGGRFNEATAIYATIAGGREVLVSGEYSVGAGGRTNSVTSGYGVLGGGLSNTVSGNYGTIAGGRSNQAVRQYCTVGGGILNTATGPNSTDYHATVGGGNSNTANAASSTIGGGENNSVTGGAGTIAGGSANTVSALYATVAGGIGNTASGQRASITGGTSNTADAKHSSVVGGTYGTTRGIIGYTAFPSHDSPIAAAAGVSQGGLLILGRETTNNSALGLRSNTLTGSTNNQLILANNSAVYFKGTVIANVTGGGDTKSWTFDGQIKRGANAAATTLTGSTVSSPYADAGASTWTVALSADTTNGGLAVTVTGQASTTIRWVCKIETTEVTY